MKLDVVVRVHRPLSAGFYDDPRCTNLRLIAKHGVTDTDVATTSDRSQRSGSIAGDDGGLRHEGADRQRYRSDSKNEVSSHEPSLNSLRSNFSHGARVLLRPQGQRKTLERR